MQLEQLGWRQGIVEQSLLEKIQERGLEIGRILIEHKEKYVLQSSQGMFNGEITGNLRYSAQSRYDFPAIGDWVAFSAIDDEMAIIFEVFPRFSWLERRAVGKFAEAQLIASNIDIAYIVQSVGQNFNINRLERYVTICHSAKITPVIILTKIDLVTEEEKKQNQEAIIDRFENISFFSLSNITGDGLDTLKDTMQKSQTYCFIGSSGVGKSTIINNLKGESIQKTNDISVAHQKGKHTTTHRELFILANGSIVIDTPGMRELGMTEQEQGMEITYEQIQQLSTSCKYNDCLHINEDGCAVLAAIANGELTEQVYQNYQKMKREQEFYSSNKQEKRKKDKKLGKLYKSIMNEKTKRLGR